MDCGTSCLSAMQGCLDKQPACSLTLRLAAPAPLDNRVATKTADGANLDFETLRTHPITRYQVDYFEYVYNGETKKVFDQASLDVACADAHNLQHVVKDPATVLGVPMVGVAYKFGARETSQVGNSVADDADARDAAQKKNLRDISMTVCMHCRRCHR